MLGDDRGIGERGKFAPGNLELVVDVEQERSGDACLPGSPSRERAEHAAPLGQPRDFPWKRHVTLQCEVRRRCGPERKPGLAWDESGVARHSICSRVAQIMRAAVERLAVT